MRAATTSKLAAASAALALSAWQARRHEVGAHEARIFRAFNGAPDALHPPVWLVMQSGSLGAVFVTAGALEWRGRRRHATAVLLAGTAVWAGAKLVKPSIGRGRPAYHLDHVEVRGAAQSGLGYPSGHAAVATTLALASSTALGPGARVAALATAATTGLARLYVGAHLPLDVVGGLALGAIAGVTTSSLLERAN